MKKAIRKRIAFFILADDVFAPSQQGDDFCQQTADDEGQYAYGGNGPLCGELSFEQPVDGAQNEDVHQIYAVT